MTQSEINVHQFYPQIEMNSDESIPKSGNLGPLNDSDKNAFTFEDEKEVEHKSIFDTEKWAIMQNNSEQAESVLQKRTHEYYGMAKNCIKEHDIEASICYFTKAICLTSDEMRQYTDRAEAYLLICDFQSAILNYKRACLLDPDNMGYFSRLAFIYYLQGQCLFDQRLYSDALESFARASEMRPDVQGYHTRSLACLAALGRHAACLALVNKRLDADSSNADVYVMRARLHDMFSNTTLCYYDVKDALSINPSHKQALALMAKIESSAGELERQAKQLNLMGRHRDALQKITAAIETDPSVSRFHVFRGAIHRRMGDFNSAIDDFLLCIDKTDHDEEDETFKNAQRQLLLTYNDFAVECYNKGFYDEAIILLNNAIKGEKTEKGLYINRGDCFYKQMEFQFAMADYEQALEMDTADVTIKKRMALIYFEFGNVEYDHKNYVEACKMYSLAIQNDNKEAKFYLARCRINQLLEITLDARQDAVRALILDPTNPEIIAILTRLFPGKNLKDIVESEFARELKSKLLKIAKK